MKEIVIKMNKFVQKLPVCKCNSDTFVCDTCETRMILKVYGDSTPCRVYGCDGTMHRQ